MGNREKRKKRELAVRKKLARQRHAKKGPHAGQTAIATLGGPRPSAPDRFTQTFADPNTMMALGPIVAASWKVPDSLATRLVAAGRPVPAPVVGFMLIDTGARSNCISIEAATDLGLTPVFQEDTYGAHGKQKTPIFEAGLVFSITDSYGNRTEVRSEQRVLGVPDMQKLFDALQVKVGGNVPPRLIGLIGRDFLRHATLIYRGTKGSFEVVLDLTSIAPPPAPVAP